MQDGPLDRGIKNTGFNSKMTAQLALNDTQGLADTVKEAHEYNQANPGMPEGKKLYDAYEKGDGFWDGVGNTVKQIGDDYTEAKGFIPGVKKVGRDFRAMGEGVITQLPNAVAPMVGTFGGAALGAAAGSEVPVVGNVAGAVVGSLVGGSAGNALVEGGGQVQDGLQKAGIDASDTQAVKAYLDENRGQLLKQTGIKGGVLGVVDTVTGGAAHALLTGPLKSATTRALTALGIDEADHAAVSAAKKSGAIDALVKNDEKYLASQKGAENIARNAGAAALEPVGEFTGEYFGQGLASDDWDTKNAGLEALSSIGQSAGTFGVQKAIQYGMSQGGAQNAADPSDNPTNPNPANPGSGGGAGVDPLARPDEARSRKQQIQEEIDLIQSKGSDATQEDLDREKRLNQQLMFEEANERIAREKIKFNGQQNLTNNSDGAGQDAINLSEIAGQLPPQKPSERMGLDPNAGALSDAAALSVDSGASGNLFLPGEDVIPWDDPVATKGTEQASPASQWDAMDAAQRASVLTSVDGMSDRNGNPNVIANRLSQLNWHNMPLGAQEKVNSAITANVAAPVNNLMQQQEELQPASSIYADQENQNRDRGRADSLAQMAGIKNDPDYDRLGRSQSPSTGAPMVFAPKETLGGLSVIGHPETVTGSDGRKIQTQYAVVEASELQASHDVSGNQNPVYSSELPTGNLKALNNGRTAGIQAAYTSGNADNYKAALIGDADRLGVDPNAIAAMKQPVLVRTYDEANNKGDMGAWSNASEGLRLSTAEQANNDARVLGDLHDVVLDDDGKFSPTKNMNLIHRFVNSLPSNEASALRKRDGSVNLPAVEKRIQHAMLAIGFNNDDLINAATEDTEQSRNLMSALTQSAAAFAKLPAQAAIGTKRLVVRAAEMYQKARESGTSVEQLGRQQDLMGGYSAHEEAIADYMEKNIRAPKKVAMVLGWLADYENQAHQSQGSMFGDDLEATKDAAIAYANQRIKQELGNDANIIREQPATTRQQPATDHGRGAGATTGAHEGATERAGRSGGAAFGLTSQTEQQLAEQEAAQAAAKEEAAQREKAAQDKANADAEVGQFTLTGSDRAADVAAAQGQQDIFSGGRREPETPDHATRWQSMSIEDRKAVLKQEGGWPTQSNGLSVIGQQLAQQDWSKLPSGMRDKIQGLMDKAQSARNANIDSAAHAAATSPQNTLQEPTQAQKEAGNYQKGHISLQGLNITIENPRGSERSGKREDGSTWSHAMSDHYGYIKRTIGADKENVDVYVGPQPDAGQVYVVDQIDQKTGKFDEHKAMIGFSDQPAAESAYRSNFDAGWKTGAVHAMSMDEFKTWLKDGDTTKPLSQQKTQSAPKQNPETKAVLAEKPEAVQQKANDILREGFSDEQYRMDSMQTRQKIADKLKNAQVSDEKGIKSLTQLWMARVVVGAKQLNMLPSEYYSRFMEGEIKRGEAPDDDSSHLYSEKDDAFGGLSSEQVALLESLGLLSKPQQEVFRELGENQWGERYVRPAGYVSSTQRGNEEVDLRGEKHQFLSDFEASVTGRGSALARAGVLAEIRKLSERVSDILQGRVTKTHSEILSPLGPFKGYEVRANIERDGVSKTLHVEVYGKEQIEAGLTDEPALLFTVSENGEFIVNGPNPNSETFREFQKRGWAEHAHDKAGNIEPDYTRLTPTPGHKTMPMDQLKPLLADVHARVRAWRKEDQVGLYWVRSTGATGGVLGRETAVFFQKGKGTKQGAVNPTTKDITLSEKDSDASTFLHETGHIFLETQIDMAGMENAGAVVKHDADTVLKWFGIAGNTMQERLAAWNAMTLEEKRQFHEQYAESFEQYLMEGKAPSKDLQSAFDNFRRWLKQVYKSIKAFLASHEGAKLNDDVRAVFDRLLATEEQIQEMEKARNAKALAGEKPLLANPAETKAFEEAAQTVVDNVASGNTEIGKAKEPASILNTSQSKYIAAQAKEQGIKKGSPGYDAAIKKLESNYEEDLNKALAALPFEQFHEWNVKDGSKSENMNRKAWEALREEYGTEDVSGSNVEPVSDTKTEMDRVAKEREELTGRAEEWESRIDAMTDEQAKGLFDAMNLAGSKSLDIKEALKEEHPDDLDEGYEELKQSNKTDLVASKKEAAKPVSTTNRNEFSIERYDREKDEIVTDRFERGEYVRAMISNNKSTFGEIDGVSHARNKVSIDGVWYSFGSIYKAERPAEPEKKNMAPLSKVIEKANEKYGEGLTEFDRVPEQYSGSKTPAKTSTVSPSSSPEEGQVSQRKTLEPGDVFVTLSGRHTTPFPKYSLKPSAGQSTKDDKKILAWLKENAIAEAQARNDKFNLLQFEGLNINNWSTADGYSVNLYMFGDEHGELAPFRVDETRPSSSKENAKRDANANDTRQNAKQEPKNATNKIEDFGEKLEGARKDYAQKLKEAKAADVAAVPFSKSWPEPNYDKLLKEGVDPLIVGFARALREQMPPKPKKGWKLKGWVDQVKYMRTFAEELLSGEIAPESVVQTLNPKNEKETTLGRLATRMLGKAEMYKALGHEATLKDFDMRAGTFDSFMGESYSPAKRVYYVEKDKRTPVAWGKTLEEAVSAFVKKQSESSTTNSEKKTEFGLWREGDSGQYFWGKKLGKNYVKLARFNTLEEAKAYKKTEGFQEEMEALLERYKTIPFERRRENAPRVGDDHRNGAAVTPEAFSEAFKFRGVQFGNYVESSRRQRDLDNAYDALSDLAAALGIPTQAISLNGKLGLAFGARGKGGKNAAAAHFEPAKVVINLTKESGAGSLAHEWFHAMDNYFAKLDGGTGNFVTNGDVNPLVPNIRPEVLEAFNNVIKAINDSGMLKRAKQLDARKSKDYWSGREEMAARAFESYIIGKLHEQNAANDYLANIVGEDYWKADEALAGHENTDTYPYPTVSEMESIGKAFDHLFDTIQTKEGDDGNVMLFSRTQSTRENYENRIDELFDGAKPNRDGVRVLDEADVLSVLGYGEKPLVLKESKVSSAPDNHPKMTVDYWKKVPEWLENPVAVFESDTKPGDLVFIPNEMVGGNVVFVTVRPDSSVMNLDVHVLTNGYDRNNYEKTPFDRWMKEGKLLYVDLKNSPAFNDTSGLQLPRVYRQARGFNANIKTERDLGNYRQTNGIQESLASHVSTGFSVAEIKESLSKTFGHAADKLQRLGLVTVVQTEKEAMDLAYKARAEKAGKDLSDFDVKYSETGDVQGFYDKQTGKSFLVADNLTDETASSVLVHEVGVHMAADTTNPRGKQAMDKMIQRAGNLLKLEKSAFMDSVRQRMKEAGETSNEEAAAYIAEEYEANRANAPSAVVQWVKDFIAAVRGWLFQRGVIVKDNMLTAADIAAIARSNVKQAAKRNGIVGLAKTQQARNVVQEPGERYETDLFGNALPPANKRRAPANTRPESAGVSGDIQPTTPLSDTEAPAGDYFVRTIVGQEVARKLGASRITTPEEAAQATQYLYKSAVERLDGIVTDKNGKPLGVVGGFKGELASSSVYPSTIVAEAIRIPGAAAIWFSHNHPSGLANLSGADINISRKLTDIFRGSGIEPMGLLSVAGDMFDYVDADGDKKYPTKIPAPESSAVRVPVIERELGSENSKQYKIEHPQDAIHIGELMRQKGGDGIMLLNSQNEVVAWVPISDVMRGDLRDTGGLAAIYRAISEANAGAAVIVHGGMLEMGHPSDRSITVGQNIAAALSKIDVRVLDIVDSLRMVSSANTGADIARGPVYSRKTSVGLHYSRAAVKQYANRAASELNKTFSSPNTLNWWHKTVGTMYNLAERSPAFKRVFDAAQGFIDDVSHYANDAADFAPTILPKLEKWSDIAKTSIASADNKAIEKPIHEGTLAWTRREDGSPVKVEDLIKESKTLSTDDKIARLLRSKKLQRGVLKMWQGMSPENLQKRVDSFYDKHLLKAGVVWNDSELKQMFGLNDKQVGLYKEYRAAIDRSLDTLARADMLRFVGEDAKDIKDAVMDADNIRDAAAMLTQHLMRKAKEDTDREKLLMELVHGIHERHDKVNELQKEGYAPLSRFGKYTVDVVDPDTGERQYFSMFETKREANAMAEAMRKEFGDKAVSQGTLSDEAYKLFSDMSPETLELFGNMLGLESTGDNTQDIAFQEYLKLTKTNRSAMRRLIHRQGIVGYSQDMPRILANFVYSNARQTAAGLNMGEMGEALNAIPKAQGELKDAAIRLADYVKNPREEAQAVRGLLFAQYLGGSVASAMVNMTQPFAVSFPYLTQFTSVKDSAAQLGRAAKELAQRNPKYDPELTAALHRAVEDGVVAPQEIHQLMAQARGSGTLSIGDGTKTGEAAAAAKNAVSKLAFGWGKVFSMAEQVNRQMTFVAAYRIARAKGMDNAEAFARKAVVDTQFQYSKANKMQWGRGAVGGTLMTFKTYSIAYVELLHRMYTQGGPEGKRAALLALGVLMLMGGASGLPFEEDMEDVAEALAQKLGYNISIKQKRQEFLSGVFGNGMANFIENGITGLPGIPIDVSGRLGMGNLIPGTGLLKTKTDHTRDVLEIAGPIGDFASRVGSGAGRILSGDVLGGALEMSPVAIRNAVKGIDMASTGMYRDQKGYKVIDTNPVEAASKAIGFQPQSVARIQEANAVNQQQKAFYNLRAGEIRGLWAQGIFEKDASKVADARAQISDWNAKNPDQRMVISIPSVMRRVKEMSKTKDQRIAASAPRAMRAKMREDVAEILNER